jgi:hypothetical protein
MQRQADTVPFQPFGQNIFLLKPWNSPREGGLETYSAIVSIGEIDERPDLSDRLDRRCDDNLVIPRPALIASDFARDGENNPLSRWLEV